MISIVAAMTDAPEWAELLVQSIRAFTSVDHEIIIIDNASRPESTAWLRRQKDVALIRSGENLHHGGAMDMGTELAHGRYVCHMDIDSHFQRRGWEGDVWALYRRNPRTRMLCKGGPIGIGRPVHPPMFFYERKFFVENKLSFKYQKGVPRSTDTAQKTYWDILDLGYEVELFGKGVPIYPMAGGDEIWLGNRPTMYHHHYGNSIKRVDENKWQWTTWALPDEEKKRHEERTAALFREPLVQRILAYGRP
jgi:glycosyltransferase involved in cell wall biosynthesis